MCILQFCSSNSSVRCLRSFLHCNLHVSFTSANVDVHFRIHARYAPCELEVPLLSALALAKAAMFWTHPKVQSATTSHCDQKQAVLANHHTMPRPHTSFCPSLLQQFVDNKDHHHLLDRKIRRRRQDPCPCNFPHASSTSHFARTTNRPHIHSSNHQFNIPFHTCDASSAKQRCSPFCHNHHTTVSPRTTPQLQSESRARKRQQPTQHTHSLCIT